MPTGDSSGSACNRGRTSITSISRASRRTSIVFVALLFDETSDDDSPGPLASRQWFESWLNALLKDGDPDQWIIALGSYGYDWTNAASTVPN